MSNHLVAEENAAGHAQKDAGKAKNASDILKAREANLKYEVDDLGTTPPGCSRAWGTVSSDACNLTEPQ